MPMTSINDDQELLQSKKKSGEPKPKKTCGDTCSGLLQALSAGKTHTGITFNNKSTHGSILTGLATIVIYGCIAAYAVD